MNFRSGCEDRPDMERPKIQMMVNDGEEEELVELAAPSADAAIRLKSGDIQYNLYNFISTKYRVLLLTLHQGDY